MRQLLGLIKKGFDALVDGLFRNCVVRRDEGCYTSVKGLSRVGAWVVGCFGRCVGRGVGRGWCVGRIVVDATAGVVPCSRSIQYLVRWYFRVTISLYRSNASLFRQSYSRIVHRSWYYIESHSASSSNQLCIFDLIRSFAINAMIDAIVDAMVNCAIDAMVDESSTGWATYWSMLRKPLTVFYATVDRWCTGRRASADEMVDAIVRSMIWRKSNANCRCVCATVDSTACESFNALVIALVDTSDDVTVDCAINVCVVHASVKRGDPCVSRCNCPCQSTINGIDASVDTVPLWLTRCNRRCGSSISWQVIVVICLVSFYHKLLVMIFKIYFSL